MAAAPDKVWPDAVVNDATCARTHGCCSDEEYHKQMLHECQECVCVPRWFNRVRTEAVPLSASDASASLATICLTPSGMPEGNVMVAMMMR